MRLPIKINEAILPACFKRFVPCKGDPRLLINAECNEDVFERSVSAINIDGTWKSTSKKRQQRTNELIKKIAGEKNLPSILEIGASAGTTSMELIEMLNGQFKEFYITDRLLQLNCIQHNRAVYYYAENHCVMWANGSLIVYSDIQNAIFPFNLIAQQIISHGNKKKKESAFTISLVKPDLLKTIKKDSRIQLSSYDVLNTWKFNSVDIVKVANVLNRTYFTDKQIVTAVENVKNALNTDGWMILTDNRECEKISVFRKNGAGMFTEEETENGGSEISDIVLGGLVH